MLIRRLRFLVVMLMVAAFLQTHVAAQDSNSAIEEEALQACGGLDSLRLNLRLTFANFPDKLAELETNLDEISAGNSETSIIGDLSIAPHSVSVLGRLGNKTRCDYISRYNSCVAKGYERLAMAIPFFEHSDINELAVRNVAVISYARQFAKINYKYIIEKRL